MEFPLDITQKINDIYDSAKTEAQKLKLQTEAAEKDEQFWAELKKITEKGWPLHALDLVNRETSRLKQMKAEGHPAVSEIETILSLAKEEADRMFRRFPSFVEDAFRENNLTLDRTSRHPKYTLMDGFLSFEIDEGKRIAHLSDYEGSLDKLPADVGAIVEAVQKEYTRLFGREFNGEKFLEHLRKQYKDILAKENQPDGSSVPIRQITRRLGKNVKGFRTDEFLVDLSKLAVKGPFEIDGRRIDLQQTKDTSQGMLLQGAASRGYIGFVIFKEV